VILYRGHPCLIAISPSFSYRTWLASYPKTQRHRWPDAVPYPDEAPLGYAKIRSQSRFQRICYSADSLCLKPWGVKWRGNVIAKACVFVYVNPDRARDGILG
ncbi:MAG: hypothetical protein ACE10C_11605, partial [Candidatus Binatia bacterium]